MHRTGSWKAHDFRTQSYLRHVCWTSRETRVPLGKSVWLRRHTIKLASVRTGTPQSVVGSRKPLRGDVRGEAVCYDSHTGGDGTLRIREGDFTSALRRQARLVLGFALLWRPGNGADLQLFVARSCHFVFILPTMTPRKTLDCCPWQQRQHLFREDCRREVLERIFGQPSLHPLVDKHSHNPRGPGHG